MPNIKIVVDTSSDIPEEVMKKYDIGRMSFLSIFGEDNYVSGVDITNEEFYRKLDSSDKIPTTAQTPYQDMYDYLLELSQKHDTVIYFTISSKGSGQFNTARLVSEEIKEDHPKADIRIVDSMSYSLFIAQTAVYAAQMAADGKSAEEIITACEAYIRSWHAFLLVDTLKYLEKGGRINKAAAVMGTLLDIKPVLTVKDGLIESEDKLRGKKKVLQKLVDKIDEYEAFDSQNPEFMIVHSDEEKGRELEALLQQRYGIDKAVLFGEFGPIVGTHVGRGAVAVIFRLKH